MKPLLRAAMPYLSAVSVNGTDKASQIEAGQGKWIQPLDNGSFDIYGFLKSLEDLGYEGPVGLQCWGIGGDAQDHLERSMRAWCDFRKRLARQENGRVGHGVSVFEDMAALSVPVYAHCCRSQGLN